ncbi:MAG: molybdopterin molybdotransferase MoeA [Actinomycetia bacterium]|nr:molybdopterin molybdotransferase MoeA [Actinomycetes bacterium]
MLGSKEAQDKILEFNYKVRKGSIDLLDSLGLVLSRDIIAGSDIPFSNRFRVEGFAVRAIDIKGADRSYPVRLKIAKQAPARDTVLEPGFCIPVRAGDPVPEGSDCVVGKDTAETGQKDVLVYQECEPGRNVVCRGQDIKKGQAAFSCGHKIEASHVGLLAWLGFKQVEVFLPPRLAILGINRKGVDVQDSPGLTVGSLSRAMGIESRLQQAVYGEDNLQKAIDSSLSENDALIITGDGTVGEYGFINDLMSGAGTELIFWKVNQQPGKNLAFVSRQEKPVFCMGGSIPSLLICFRYYVYPFLARAMGRTDIGGPVVQARALQKVVHRRGRTDFMLVRADRQKGYVFSPACTDRQGLFDCLRDAAGMVSMAEDTGDIMAGDTIEVMLFSKNEKTV